jgi:hypothetical protein
MLLCRGINGMALWCWVWVGIVFVLLSVNGKGCGKWDRFIFRKREKGTDLFSRINNYLTLLMLVFSYRRNKSVPVFLPSFS